MACLKRKLTVSRKEKAVQKKSEGYNCAQAVACNYCDFVEIDEETMFRLTEGLGIGMGNMEGTCGALTGACIVAGLLNSTANLKKPDSKAATSLLARTMMDKFKSRNTTVTCKTLKGKETGKVLRSCQDCIRDACEFLEEILG